MKIITMVGTLPPIKGMSVYCVELLTAISKDIKVEFIGFKSIYPNFLYPGGTTVENDDYISESKNADIRNIVTYYNPLSWIWAGLTVKGDIVHAQWWAHVLAPIFFVILKIAKMRRKKIIITVHNVQPHEKGAISSFLNGTILKLGDYFITHTINNRDSLSNIYNIDKEKITVIPMGIFAPRKIKGITKGYARNFLGISLEKKVLLQFGNIRDYKGLDIMLQSLRQIRDIRKDIILLIAGKPWEDWSKYQKIIEKEHLEDFIIKHLDYIQPSEVEYYFAASDIVVLPYKYFDAQSGVGELAIPFKKPMIVTNVGGLPNLVKDNNVIANPEDSNDIARIIINMLKDENWLLKLANHSDELSREFTWDKIATQTIKLYGMSMDHKEDQ